MNPSLFPSSAAWSCLLLDCALLFNAPAAAAPFVPRDDSEILARVPDRRDPLAVGLRERHVALSANPGNWTLASDLAQRYLQLHRASGDPRHLGRAQSVLAPWWEASAPVPILVQRATLKQSLHDFPGALRDLHAALQQAPDDGQAWLTKATILTVCGDYEQARRCCLALARLASDVVVVTASASVAALTGQAERSCEVLRQALARNGSAPAGEKVWAQTVLAEACARLGQTEEAERHFREALALGERDLYLLGAFADFLLDAGRPREAAQWLRSETGVEGLLLRLALAESRQTPPPETLARNVRRLQEWFLQAQRRGDSIHHREQARFALHLLRQPGEALQLAAANWKVQREPADVRILLEAALAAGQPKAAADAVHFVRTNQLQDRCIERLVAALTAEEAQ